MAKYNVSYTGRIIVTSLKEVYKDSNTPTGLTKMNILGDPNYIQPYVDNAQCLSLNPIIPPKSEKNTFDDDNNFIELQLPPLTPYWVVKINGIDYISVETVTVYNNKNYLRINWNNEIVKNPLISLRLYNEDRSFDVVYMIN